MCELRDLDIVERPTREQFRALYVAPEVPIRIRGALRDWPALGTWSPDDFRARFGDVEVATYAMKNGRIELDPKLGFRLLHMTVRDYVDHVENDSEPRHYWRSKLPGPVPRLLEEIRTPDYCGGGALLRQNLWFSAPNTISHLHFDLPHNLVAQVHGRKKFILFRRDQAQYLYPHSIVSSVPHLSRVDPEHPDLFSFPQLARARGYVCTLEPGDLLFIPSRCWHHAHSMTASITVNFWWAEGVTRGLVQLSDLYKRVRGLNI